MHASNKGTSTVPSTDSTPLDGDADRQSGVDEPGLPVTAIGGGVGGLAVLIVVVVLVVLLLRRRLRYVFEFSLLTKSTVTLT